MFVCACVCVCVRACVVSVTDLHLRPLSPDGDGYSSDPIDLKPDSVLVLLGLFGVEGQCHLHGVPWTHYTRLKEDIQVGSGGREAGNAACGERGRGGGRREGKQRGRRGGEGEGQVYFTPLLTTQHSSAGRLVQTLTHCMEVRTLLHLC